MDPDVQTFQSFLLHENNWSARLKIKASHPRWTREERQVRENPFVATRLSTLQAISSMPSSMRQNRTCLPFFKHAASACSMLAPSAITIVYVCMNPIVTELSTLHTLHATSNKRQNGT